MATAGRPARGPAAARLKPNETVEVMVRVTLEYVSGAAEWVGHALAYDLAETIGNELGTIYLDANGEDSLDQTEFKLTAARSGDAYLTPRGSQR